MSTAAPKTDLGRQIVRQLDMSRRMVTALADDFTEEEAVERIAPHKPLVWYLAHVAVAENAVLTLFFDHPGLLTPEFVERFGRGSDASGDFSDVSKAEIVDILERMYNELKPCLRAATSEDLAREPNRQVPHPAFANLGSAISLICAHTAYHAGQIAMLRSAMGKSAMFG